jgi:hypothetical protein
MKPLFFVGLPSIDDLRPAPERAILSALQANLVLAVRVLDLLHAEPYEAFEPEPEESLADAIRACATSLHTMLLAYDECVWRKVRRDDSAADRPPRT